jgi:hypothetical protein
MPTAADYRRQAETCLSLALSAPDELLADKLRSMACDLMARSLHPDEEPEAQYLAELPPFASYRTEEPVLPAKS